MMKTHLHLFLVVVCTNFIACKSKTEPKPDESSENEDKESKSKSAKKRTPSKDTEEDNSERKMSTREMTWALAQSLSLSVVGQSQGAEEGPVQRVYKKAETIGKTLKIEIDALPSNTGTKAEKGAEALRYLLSGSGKTIAGALKKKYGDDHAALFELATRSHAIQLIYSPDATDLVTSGIRGIERATQTAQIPEKLVKPLISSLKNKESIKEVSQAVQSLQSTVASYLSKENKE